MFGILFLFFSACVVVASPFATIKDQLCAQARDNLATLMRIQGQIEELGAFSCGGSPLSADELSDADWYFFERRCNLIAEGTKNIDRNFDPKKRFTQETVFGIVHAQISKLEDAFRAAECSASRDA